MYTYVSLQKHADIHKLIYILTQEMVLNEQTLKWFNKDLVTIHNAHDIDNDNKQNMDSNIHPFNDHIVDYKLEEEWKSFDALTTYGK
jgi:hypothetical protein